MASLGSEFSEIGTPMRDDIARRLLFAHDRFKKIRRAFF
jgi:hypothetical protein